MKGFRKIPCVIQRGGTSKGVYLHEKDLPEDPEMRDKVILAIFGSPDKRQIDGLGGADPLTSKCAIIGPSKRKDADVDYTMCQVDINKPIVDFRGNCGNISSGVGPFAIDEGLVKATDPETIVKIYNTNTNKLLKAYVSTFEGEPEYLGDYAIDGVPGTSSKILLDFSATEGAVTGKLLPSGNVVDLISIPSIGKIEASIVDAGNPACFIKSESVDLSGIEGPLDASVIRALDRIELIRATVAKELGFVDDPEKARTKSPTLPMIFLVSKPISYTSFADGSKIDSDKIDFVARCFFMQEMHKTYPGSGTVCTGAAAMIEGTLVNQVSSRRSGSAGTIRIGHPSGTVSIEVEVVRERERYHLKKAAFGRTSRRILEGFVYVPESILQRK
jgi:methylitaconate Delta-isomerase